MAVDFPLIMTAAGPVPTPPAAIRAVLVAEVAATNPGYTDNLPGSLVEDVASTDVAAVALCDHARVELINSLTPFGANAFLLNQLGQVYGVPLGVGSNTSVNVVFSGPPGFVIARGFTVSDGAFQYVVQDGGIIGGSGQSLPLFALATQPGSWAVPANTVTQLITPPPQTIALTATNPLPGTPGGAPQTEGDYRGQVLQAGLAASMGMSRYLKTLLGRVPGVQGRLVSARVQSGNTWEIIVGGGDPYLVAYAIYDALFDVATLVGSTMSVTNVTRANPGVVTTLLNHGLATGQAATITGASPVNYNGTFTIAKLSANTFSIGVDTTGFPAYAAGGVVTPNPRNTSASINDYPDVYVIPIVLPPQQAVEIALTWNTDSPNVVSASGIAQLGSPALVDYVNSIPVGAPINLFELQEAFQLAVASILPAPFLTRMVFAVSIDGVGVSPEAGTGIIEGDPESYFLTDSTLVVITQG